jgi:uncharacterized protein (TIGR02466 family)
MARFAVDGFDQHQSELLSLGKKLRRQHKSKEDSSNVGNFHSKNIYASDWSEFESGKWLVDTLTKHLKETVMHFSGDETLDSDIELTNTWYIITDPRTGFWHLPHDHPGSYMSGVLYLKANPRGKSPKTGMAEFVGIVNNNSISSYLAQGLQQSSVQLLTHAPTEGELIIFPSSLSHMVGPHLAYAERIAISFNTRSPHAMKLAKLKFGY